MTWKSVPGKIKNIKPGQTITEEFNFDKNDPGDGPQGQVIIPNPKENGGWLQINSQSKRLNPDGSVSYFVTYTNIGTVATDVDFAGGTLA
jgi:hypothetical protein